MHESTFSDLMPTGAQAQTMASAREAYRVCAAAVATLLPDGPDKDHAIRMLRGSSMWANIAITREADGSLRA